MNAFAPSADLSSILPPAPRQVARRSGRAGRSRASGCFLLFLMPHTLVGIVGLGYALALSATWLFGPLATARVTGLKTESGESTTYRVLYDYRVAGSGAIYSDRQSVSFSEYSALGVGQVVPALSSPLWPERFSMLLLSGGIWEAVGKIWAWAIIWNGTVGLFWAVVISNSLGQKYLLRHGQATSGVLTRRQVVAGSYSDSHTIHFSWQSPDGITREARRPVESDEYLAARQGSPLTVLFDPRRPRRAVPLEYSDYEIVG